MDQASTPRCYASTTTCSPPRTSWCALSGSALRREPGRGQAPHHARAAGRRANNHRRVTDCRARGRRRIRRTWDTASRERRTCSPGPPPRDDNPPERQLTDVAPLCGYMSAPSTGRDRRRGRPLRRPALLLRRTTARTVARTAVRAMPRTAVRTGHCAADHLGGSQGRPRSSDLHFPRSWITAGRPLGRR